MPSRIAIAVFAFKLLAIYLGFWAVLTATQLATMAAIPNASDFNEVLLMGMVSTGAMALFAIGLFVLAPRLARRLFPDAQPDDELRFEDIGALALQIAGILLLDRAVEGLGGLAHWDADLRAFASAQFAVAVGMQLLLAALGVTLMLGSTRIARTLFGVPVGARARTLSAQLQAAAFAVLGAWILASAIPEVASSIAHAAALNLAWSDMQVSQTPIGPCLRCAIGLGLFFGADALARFWHWVRHAGLEPREHGS